MSVGEVARVAPELWGDGRMWTTSGEAHPHEANLVALDATNAERAPRWVNGMRLPSKLSVVVDWHRAVDGGANSGEVTMAQIHHYREFREGSA